MGRDVSLVIEVTGELVCCGPLHVGDWHDGPGNRMPVQRDGQHQLLIPGTSIAGALRSWLSSVSTASGPFDTRRLFGHIVPGTERGDASLFQVDDAVAGAGLDHRDGVAIDRGSGAAAGGFLYEREVVPAGTRFTFRLTAHEPRAGGTRVGEAVSCLVAALAAGRITFGARRSAAWGACDWKIRGYAEAIRRRVPAWSRGCAGNRPPHRPVTMRSAPPTGNSRSPSNGPPGPRSWCRTRFRARSPTPCRWRAVWPAVRGRRSSPGCCPGLRSRARCARTPNVSSGRCGASRHPRSSSTPSGSGSSGPS